MVSFSVVDRMNGIFSVVDRIELCPLVLLTGLNSVL